MFAILLDYYILLEALFFVSFYVNQLIVFFFNNSVTTECIRASHLTNVNILGH